MTYTQTHFHNVSTLTTAALYHISFYSPCNSTKNNPRHHDIFQLTGILHSRNIADGEVEATETDPFHRLFHFTIS